MNPRHVQAFLLITSVLMAQRAEYPGKKILRSPSGRYEIFPKEVPSSEDRHLFLRNLTSKEILHLYAFERSVDVLWSPDSRTLAITDYLSSCYGTTYFISLNNLILRTDIDKIILKQFPEDDWFMHRYISAKRWLDSNTLEVLVNGHTDETGKQGTEFQMVYHCTLAGELKRMARLRRLPNQKHFHCFSDPCPIKP